MKRSRSCVERGRNRKRLLQRKGYRPKADRGVVPEAAQVSFFELLTKQPARGCEVTSARGVSVRPSLESKMVSGLTSGLVVRTLGAG